MPLVAIQAATSCDRLGRNAGDVVHQLGQVKPIKCLHHAEQSSWVGHDCLMGGELFARRSRPLRRPDVTSERDPMRTSGGAALMERYLQLQRQAGNRAVLSLLRWGARAADISQSGSVRIHARITCH